MKVLYEDNHIIAVFKPSNVLTQGDKTGDVSLFSEVKKYLKEKYKKPGNAFLGLVHRLDRPACGIVLFAKTSKGAQRLSEQFKKKEVEKTYHALVEGKPKESRGVILTCLRKDEKTRKAVVVKDDKSVKPVKLFYETIRTNQKYSLLKVRIETGKFHQIRAQLASIGNPVVGDVKYGAGFPLPNKSVCLCADSIEFKLAVKEERKNVSLPIPDSWKKYLKF